jgi:DNA-binding MarR family transcriptional regulator
VVGDWTSDWTSDRFQVAFWTTKRAMAEAADAAYRRHGVRSGQQFILMALWDEDGLTPGELAKQLGLATPTVTKATHRMETAGLVVRRPHPHDRRLVRIHLTERGMALRKEFDAEMHALSESALAGFTDAERAQFVEFLERLYRSLRGKPG